MGTVPPAPEESWKSRKDLINAISGASSGVIASIFVCPLDLLKTRFHVHGHPDLLASSQRSLILASFEDIIKKDGFKGLYRGLSPTIIAYIPTWAVYFTVYEKLKAHFRSPDGQLSVKDNIYAAIGAGSTTAVVTNPLWVVKTQFMTQGLRPGEVPYRSTISALISISSSKEGIFKLYSGLLPSLVGVSHVAIQFPAYEKLKTFLAEQDNTTPDKLSPRKLVVATALSKLLASSLTYPHEVIRSILQDQARGSTSAVQCTGVVDCTKKVLKKDGFKGLYRGFATNLVRTIPSNMITFISFELISRHLRRVYLPEA